ncbi:uncharacterized protein At4g26485-like [Momordica charantia]|uniref:Uncharacterized protein At4g26485-like n=1 Tax=Momordica charantia TaxID=3673 RepID=A0A6J1CDH1_MOMCH|nr:uncharacterized protein At4g26485-like [Momordica charantia]
MEDLNNSRDQKWIKHYSSSHTILLVGEGDFSFSTCLATTFGSAANMVATSLDSKESLLSKYTHVATNLKELEELGCTVAHDVDATSMSQHPLLRHKSFDRVVFNFPHAGFHFKESDIRQIELHRHLVRGFLRNAKEFLGEEGEIHITHKTAHPFSRWEIVELAREEGLLLKEEPNFFLWEYPNYENKRGDGWNSDGTFPVGACRTFKFAITDDDQSDSSFEALIQSLCLTEDIIDDHSLNYL